MDSHTVTLGLLLVTAAVTAAGHTLAGPDHYLPFIAIAQSRRYSVKQTLFWTLLCGIGHVGSALLLALAFLLLARWLSAAQIAWIEAWRGNLAAYALIGMGAAIVLHSLYCRWKHKPHSHKHVHVDGTVTVHTHDVEHDHAHTDEKSLSYWVVFIIFVLGPCEALLPLLTAAAVFDAASVVLVAAVFSVVTIATMMAAVAFGLWGIHALRIQWLERFAPEIAGGTVMLCGMAIAFLGW